ncbi:MAG TPA: succinate dehydrogenase cytochrome b subunit [Candidatus Akkermansia intestinavium]|nr:succinate dehydrogenase cytochrome b subunit [Candidatus Akkermansia intestinavium]
MNDIITTACKFVTSSIGRKILVALTGACLLLFLVGHLAGNMTIYGGDGANPADPSWINAYATGLHTMPAWLLWAIRLGLLAVLLIHVVLTLVLKYENYNARTHYQKEGTLKATLSSRTMVITGCMIFCFLVFHLWQLTFNGDPANCYEHIIAAFSNPWCSLFYIVAICCLFMHVRHGVQSVMQTLGLSTRKVRPLYNIIAVIFGIIVCGGFITIPVAVLTGYLQ